MDSVSSKLIYSYQQLYKLNSKAYTCPINIERQDLWHLKSGIDEREKICSGKSKLNQLVRKSVTRPIVVLICSNVRKFY